jgi:uncharacterized membrane protein
MEIAASVTAVNTAVALFAKVKPFEALVNIANTATATPTIFRQVEATAPAAITGALSVNATFAGASVVTAAVTTSAPFTAQYKAQMSALITMTPTVVMKVIGDDWTPVPIGTEIWTDVTLGNEVWTDVSVTTGTWVNV